MNILQVVPRIAARSSGPSYSVSRLCNTLEVLNGNVALHVLEPLPEENPGCRIRGYPSAGFPGAYRLGWSPAMKKGLNAAARKADILHNHSLWMMPNIYCHKAAKRGGCKLVFSPRGTLSEWALNRSRFRKGLVWRMGQRAALLGADCLHATSEMELEEIRRLGIRLPVAVIPNGIGLPAENLTPKPKGHRRHLLFLSRLHPKKGLDLLLTAWSELEGEFPDWDLLVAGPLQGAYPKKMQDLSRALGLRRVKFWGEALGHEKTHLLATAELFVLPTHSENFGLAVAEALSHGTPVVVSRNAPWPGIEEQGCGWWIKQDKDKLLATLRKAMALPADRLAAMGGRGRAWMAAEFAWETVGRKILHTYQWLLGRSARPDWVEVAGT